MRAQERDNMIVAATARELGELFILISEDKRAIPVNKPDHPSVELLGRMAVRDLDKTTGQNVLEHAEACGLCSATIDAIMGLATDVASDRRGIAEGLGLTVSLVDTYRSYSRRSN